MTGGFFMTDSEGTVEGTNGKVKPMHRPCITAGAKDIDAMTTKLTLSECVYDPRLNARHPPCQHEDDAVREIPEDFSALYEMMKAHVKNPTPVCTSVPMRLTPSIGTEDVQTQLDIKYFLLTYGSYLIQNDRDRVGVLYDLQFVAQNIRAEPLSSIPTDAEMKKLSEETTRVCAHYHRVDLMKNYEEKLKEFTKSRIAIFADLLWLQVKVRECPWAYMQPIPRVANCW